MAQPEYPDGFTPISNEWLESAAKSKLFSQKVRVLLVIIRKTWGWQKNWDEIAFSQIEKMTDMSPSEVKRAVRGLINMRVIDKRKGDKSVSGNKSVTIPHCPNKYRVAKYFRERARVVASTKSVPIRWLNIARAIVLEHTFNEFWDAYPRRVNKRGSRKSWVKLNLSKSLVKKIMKGLVAAKVSRQWTKDNGEFIPHPTTWLNQHRWEDEIEEKKDARNF